MAYLALDPVLAAVFSTLNVPALTALAPGGVVSEIPQTQAFPFVFVQVIEHPVPGFGVVGLPEISLRVHGYSVAATLMELHAIIAKAIELLRHQALTVSGYAMCGRVFYDDTVAIADSIINGVKCHELVAMFRLFVEET
jgi:hypothetical protein